MSNVKQQRKQAMSDISRAHRAKEILDNPLYLEAMIAMQAAMFEEFRSTKLDKPELRHELWQRMQLQKQFQGRFESIVKHGEKGQQTLNMLDRAKQAIGL